MEAAHTQRFTVSQVAEVMGVHEETVRRWIRAGELAAANIGKGYQVDRSDLETFYHSRGGEGPLFGYYEPDPDELEPAKMDLRHGLRIIGGEMPDRGAQLMRDGIVEGKTWAEIANTINRRLDEVVVVAVRFKGDT